MKLSRTMKKVLAYICAFAMVVTSMTGYRKQVNAATYSITDGSGVTYTIANERGTYPGFVSQGAFDNVRFTFAWNTVDGATTATVEVKKDGETVLDLGSKGSGVSIYTSEFAVLEDGTYELIFTGNTDQVETLDLTIQGTGEVTTVDPTKWTDATDVWTTNGVWNIWTGNGAASRYKGNNTLNDYYVNTITTTGEWSVQTNTVIAGMTAGTMYSYTIKIESDKEGAYVGVKEDFSNSPIVYKSLSVGENEIKGTFTAVQPNAKMFFEMGNPANTGATFHITGVEIKEYEEDDSEGIPVGAKWLGWFEEEGWASYPISDNAAGYTLTDKNIGNNWYSIQTGVDNIKFKPDVEYTCRFTLTVNAPKQFKVDNRSNDGTVFVETIPGEWKDNGDGTYTYDYVGTYKNTSGKSEFINVRVSLGYFTDEENYEALSTLTCTMSDFSIVSTGEKPVETTTETPSETSTEAPSETSTEAPSETSTEAPSETSTEAPSETSTEASSETSTEAPSETSTETPSETSTETPSETSTEAPSETSTETPSETSTEAPSETSTETPSETSTEASSETTTGAENTTTPTQDVTTVAPAKVKAPAKAKIAKVSAKKLASTKAKLSLKKVNGAKGYQVAVYKTKKFAKKNKKALVKKFVKKVKATVKSKKLKNKKTLFVRVRAYALADGKKIYGKWSEVKKIKVK